MLETVLKLDPGATWRIFFMTHLEIMASLHTQWAMAKGRIEQWKAESRVFTSVKIHMNINKELT